MNWLFLSACGTSFESLLGMLRREKNPAKSNSWETEGMRYKCCCLGQIVLFRVLWKRLYFLYQFIVWLKRYMTILNQNERGEKRIKKGWQTIEKYSVHTKKKGRKEQGGREGRKEGRKGGRKEEVGRKEEKEEESREASREIGSDSIFWCLVFLFCSTYEQINKKSWVLPPWWQQDVHTVLAFSLSTLTPAPPSNHHKNSKAVSFLCSLELFLGVGGNQFGKPTLFSTYSLITWIKNSFHTPSVCDIISLDTGTKF